MRRAKQPGVELRRSREKAASIIHGDSAPGRHEIIDSYGLGEGDVDDNEEGGGKENDGGAAAKLKMRLRVMLLPRQQPWEVSRTSCLSAVAPPPERNPPRKGPITLGPG